MKATKKIVGAACALVAAVALSAGSTFAWFVSNGEVSATGLTVDVKTNNAYLVISDTVSGLADGETTLDLTSVGQVDGKAVELIPSAYDVTPADGKFSATATEGSKVITDPTAWYTGEGTDANDGTLSGDKEYLTSGNFGKYVVETDIYVSVLGAVAIDTVNMELEATPGWNTTAGTNNDAITVLILYRTVENAEGATAGDWSYTESKSGSHVIGTGGKVKINEDALASTHYIQLHVMVYFDGDNTAVTTANQLNLAGVTLNFKFTDGKASENVSGGEGA